MIKVKAGHFRDKEGRIILMRGLNLGANSKTPQKYFNSSRENDIFSKKKISFVNKPFPLDQADEHFKRIKYWGFDFIRLLITWEAIEHEAPGVYDEQYLEYIKKLIEKAKEHDLKIIINPNQDVWSRFSGGDGAPRWTFEVAGLDIIQFAEAGAAFVKEVKNERETFQDMIWITNYTKLAAATMFTLFFGGNDFAPKTKVQDKPIQDFLQEHYINAFVKLAETIKDLDNVIGFGTMNQPSPGWIAHKDLNTNTFPFKKGAMPTPFQAMVLGNGNPLEVEKWELGKWGFKNKGKIELNPKGVKAWLNGYRCIWKTHEVWFKDEKGNMGLNKPDYFHIVNGKEVNFTQDYLLPFTKKFTKKIKEIKDDILIFADYPLNENPPSFIGDTIENLVHPSPWYNYLSLLNKNFSSWFSFDFQKNKTVFGKKKVRDLFFEQVKQLKDFGQSHFQNTPTVITQVGIPFDMNKGKSFQKNDFSLQNKALDSSLKAIESNLLSYFIWSYTPTNTNEYGDQWNDENLSIFSKDQRLDKQNINSGGRALKAFLRPFPKKIAGEPISFSFDMRKQVMELRFKHDSHIKQSTVIYIPEYQYPSGYRVEVSDGNYEMLTEKQLLMYHHSPEKEEHFIKVFK